MRVYTQETEPLFRDIREVARRVPSQQKTKLIGHILHCELVELIQKMWRKYFKPELLQQMNDLPPHLFASLQVITQFPFLHYAIRT